MNDMNRLTQELRQNPAALQSLMQSPDGQALLHLLTQKDRGAGLQQAVQSAMKGDTTKMADMVREIMQSPDGAQLVERINQAARKYRSERRVGTMAEFDDKLSSILSNPDTMAQIMQLAQSISGGADASTPPPPPVQQPQTSFNPLASLGGMDPGLLLKLLPLVQELGSGQDSNAKHLLYALSPYLKPERQAKVDRALQLARLFHVGKQFLTKWEG